jgi:hypothetical protein
MEHIVHLTKGPDSDTLIVSVDGPRFCLSAPDDDQAIAAARRALSFYATFKRARRAAVATPVTTNELVSLGRYERVRVPVEEVA